VDRGVEPPLQTPFGTPLTEENLIWNQGGGDRKQATAEQYTYTVVLWLEHVYLGSVSLVLYTPIYNPTYSKATY
jgi:hypothetical protein